MSPNRRQAIFRTNADPIHWRIYAVLGGDALKHGYLSSFSKTVPPFRQHLLRRSMTSHTIFYIHVQNNHFCGECFPWNIMIITTKITKITKMTSMRPVLYSMLPSTTTGHAFICSTDLNGLIPTLILYGRNSLQFKINCVHCKLVGEWTLAGENPQTSHISHSPMSLCHLSSSFSIIFWNQMTILDRYVINQGLNSQGGWASYHKVLRSLKAVRLDVMMIVSLWNVTGILAAMLSMCL